MLKLSASFPYLFKISETIVYFKEELYLLKCFRKAHRTKKTQNQASAQNPWIQAFQLHKLFFMLNIPTLD